tara:strand:+ start:168 stop:404 length:237 start_codon:yes stop_codon:yes gene_type:complete
MKTLIRPEVNLKSLRIRNKIHHHIENENSATKEIDSKFYQKLIVVLISFSLILIFPESPKDLEVVCNSYYSRQICNVW